MAVSSSLFFVLSLSETDARVVEAIEAVVEAAELAAFACDAKKGSLQMSNCRYGSGFHNNQFLSQD